MPRKLVLTTLIVLCIAGEVLPAFNRTLHRHVQQTQQQQSTN